MTNAENFFDSDPVADLGEDLRQLVIAAMKDYANNRPRSLQKRIGPSQSAPDCLRKLAYAVNAEEGPNRYTDPLPSMIGTAMHKEMEEVFKRVNRLLVEAGKPERFLIETKVLDPIEGTMDCYDLETNTVIDWKFLGTTTHSKYAKAPNVPPPHYQGQVQEYGLGMVNLGYPVEHVAICMIPRSGRLKDTVFWIVPFDPQRAEKIADRVRGVEVLTAELDVKANPYRYRMFPATPSESDCTFCPHLNPLDSGNPFHCKGIHGVIDPLTGKLVEDAPE